MMLARQSSSTCANPETLSAFCTWSSRSCLSTGLVRKPNAPLWVACTASGMVPCAVRMMTSQSRPAALQLLEQADAVHLIHAQVRDHEIRAEPRAGGERRGGAFDRFDLVVLGAQADGQKAQQPRIVVDHQNPRLALLSRVWSREARLQAERQGGGGGNRIGVQCSLSGGNCYGVCGCGGRAIVDGSLDVRDRLELGSSLVQRFAQPGVFVRFCRQPAVGRLQLVARIMRRFVAQSLVLGLQDQPLVDLFELHQGQ